MCVCVCGCVVYLRDIFLLNTFHLFILSYAGLQHNYNPTNSDKFLFVAVISHQVRFDIVIGAGDARIETYVKPLQKYFISSEFFFRGGSDAEQ